MLSLVSSFQKGKPLSIFLPHKSRFLYDMLVGQVRARVNGLSYVKRTFIMDSFWGPQIHFIVSTDLNLNV